MKKKNLFVSVILLVGILSAVWIGLQTKQDFSCRLKSELRMTEEKIPNDWFHAQRAYPELEIPTEARIEGYLQAQEMKLSLGGISPAPWIAKGPTNIGGRITCLALHPTNQNIVYAGAADGGVLFSTDGGANWQTLTDNLPSLSMGDIALSPLNPNVVYAGTGEQNLAGDNYDGDGLYRSTDGGNTWTNIGLSQTRRIGRIALHPTNSNVIYVAGAGAQFSSGPDRGVYKTTDGGVNWSRVLFVSDSTSAIDIVIDQTRPDVLYAAMWERMRWPYRRKAGGITSGIYKTTNGGTNWTQLTTGLPSGRNVGRIGLALSRSNPDILYAIYADATGYFSGVYKTTNGGANWTRTNDRALSDLYSSFGWYFGNIRVSPVNPNIVFALGVTLYRSIDGGASWANVSGITHVDHHALEFYRGDPNRIVDGNDGGVYFSVNGGSSWTKSLNLPITQFYAATIDDLLPQRTYGGTQDNGTMRTLTGNLNDWEEIYGGDGFYCIVDYTNSNIIYAESQYGELGKSTNGGSSFFDATNGINSRDRRNWSTPVVMDMRNSNILYYGTYRVYKTTNGAGVWSAISSDLTNGPGQGNLAYGTITTIAVSKTDGNVIYAGTDDANVWVTTNGGGNWTRINTGLPNRWVTRVAVDPFASNIAYVTLSGYRNDSRLPHIFRTTNFGGAWTDISSNLPQVPINVVVVDPRNTATLFVGTDYGVYATTNTGGTWFPLGTSLPNSAVCDLVLHNPTRKLRAGTHGRSFFEYDLNQMFGIEEKSEVRSQKSEVRITATPNPFSSYAMIPGHEKQQFSVYDITGRLVGIYKGEKIGEDLNAGVYFIKPNPKSRILNPKNAILRVVKVR